MSSIDTMRYWPRRVECASDLPPLFKEEAEGVDLGATEVIYAPVAASPFSPRRENLIIFDGATVTVHTSTRGGKSTFSAKPSQVSRLEWGCVLLRSWLTIAAPSGESTIIFNSVREDLFARLVTAVRGAREPDEESIRRFDGSSLDHLITRAYKFMNYGRRSMLPDELLIASLYQEPLPVRTLRIGGFKLLTQYATPRLLLLTDRELIVIREEQELSLSRRPAYGCVRTFIPAGRLAGFELDELGPAAVLEIQTSDGYRVRSRVDPENQELPPFVAALRVRSPGMPARRQATGTA